MTKNRHARNIPASVRQRLMNLHRGGNQDFNARLTQYAIERFLYRLSKSELSGHFVLKGAMLFRVWSGSLRRPTKDLDLLGYGDPSPAAVADAVRQIIATPVVNDGLVFEASSVSAREIREEQEYGGVRVNLVSMLGNARIPMQVDVGFGDAVTPQAQMQFFPTLLDMDKPCLRMYPPETVIAEKILAAVTLGMVNSRMKDFYDIVVIFRIHELTSDDLARAIAATFHCRKIPLPGDVPAGLSDEFGSDAGANRIWSEFRRRLGIEDAPDDFSVIIAEVRRLVWPAMVLARRMSMA